MNKNDKKIKQLMEQVEKQKQNLGKRPKVSWNTNGLFKFNDTHLNINVAKKSQLVHALSILIIEKSAHDQANNILNLNEKFERGGYQYEDWEEDFKTKAKIIQWENKKKTLDNTIKQLNSLMSEDSRTERELENIEDLLDNIG